MLQWAPKPTEHTEFEKQLDVVLVPQLRISSAILAKQAQRFLNRFPGTTSFAVKANDDPAIVSQLANSGIAHFDVASIPEMASISKIAPSARLHYHNPVRSTEELQIALTQHRCRRFAVDHFDELEKITAHVDEPGEIEIAIRFRDAAPSQAVQAFSSKFGASELEAAQLLQRAQRYGFKTGLTFHPGSQTLTPEPYVQHIETAARISKTSGINPDFLNVGGGFPANYTGLNSPPLEVFFADISSATAQNFGKDVPLLECEPGRSLVAEAGTLTTTIKAVRSDRREFFLNDGIYGGLMEVSQFPKLQPRYALKSVHHEPHDLEQWTVYGPTCDPIDVLPFKLRLPGNVAEGTQLSFYGVGAYSTATATRFNGYGRIDVVVV